MAKILADRDIKKLLGSVIVGAAEDQLNPNGIELSLGEHVRFNSTEDKDGILKEGSFLKIHPGETVTISSLEAIDFRAATTQAIFPGKMLMGLITPTTTMMREGISQVSTKIDAGFEGILSWGLRNGSAKDLILQYGGPIFKLTIFLLEQDETPELAFGERPGDKSYMGAKKIVETKRRLPPQIPKDKIVSSSYGKLDPKEQLREAGYPFEYISTELASLEGELKIVTTGHKGLLDKMENLSSKFDGTFERVEIFFTKKFHRLIVMLVAFVSGAFSFIIFLRSKMVSEGIIAAIGIMVVFAAIVSLLVLESSDSKVKEKT